MVATLQRSNSAALFVYVNTYATLMRTHDSTLCGTMGHAGTRGVPGDVGVPGVTRAMTMNEYHESYEPIDGRAHGGGQTELAPIRLEARP